MRIIGSYDHLNPIKVELDLDVLAKTIVNSNYGVHRLLSALVRARKIQYPKDVFNGLDILSEIDKPLNKGYY